jgi:transcription antitermination factor NusG
MQTSKNSDVMIIEEDAWYALYTRHQHEKTIAEMLTNKGFDVFLPLYQSIRRWKDRKKTLSMPLFPGYVFLRGGLSRRVQILSTPGVHMILCRGSQVSYIPDGEIRAIQRTVEGPYRVEPHPFLKCGDKVRVRRGALEGVEGVLVRKKNLCRLVLSVDMLAQSVGVEIDAADVEVVQRQDSLHSIVIGGATDAGSTRESILKLNRNENFGRVGTLEFTKDIEHQYRSSTVDVRTNRVAFEQAQ